jgi:hypothetical protein
MHEIYGWKSQNVIIRSFSIGFYTHCYLDIKTDILLTAGDIPGCLRQGEETLPHRWRSAMLNYRLYFLDGAGKHIERFEPIAANNDAEAVETAKLYRSPWPVELWLRERKIDAFLELE